MTDLRQLLTGRAGQNVDAGIRAVIAAGVQLPADLARAQQAFVAVTEGRAKLRRLPAPPSAEDDAQRIMAAANDGDELPDDIAEHGVLAYQQRQAAEHVDRAWRLASEQAMAEREMAFKAIGMELYTGPLRERLDAVLDGVRGVAADLGGLDPEDPATLAGDERALAAYEPLATLADQYDAIRAAQAQLRPFLGQPKVDVHEWYAELANAEALFGSHEQWLTSRSDLARTLGPARRLQRLVWLVTSAAEPWLPLPEEQDAAYTAEAARLEDERQAYFLVRQAEAAARGEQLVLEGVTAEQWSKAQRVAMGHQRRVVG